MSAKKQTPWNQRSFRTLGFGGLIVVVVALWTAARPAPRLQTGDMETCGTCHEDAVKAFQLNPHASAETAGCTACHDQAEKHREEGGKGNIFAFRPSDLPAEKSRKCLTCHSKDNTRYAASPHGKAALDCTTCHSIHAEDFSPPLLRTSANKNCSLCHQDIFAEFQLNERHRLQEGILSCTSCHNPHEPATRNRLAGFKQEECLKCHIDKGGPYVHEHLASRVEGCTICHETHGSVNRHMLKFQNTADLCFSCHAGAPAWHANFSSQGTNCVTCHTAIHGSNLDKRFLK